MGHFYALQGSNNGVAGTVLGVVSGTISTSCKSVSLRTLSFMQNTEYQLLGTKPAHMHSVTHLIKFEYHHIKNSIIQFKIKI